MILVYENCIIIQNKEYKNIYLNTAYHITNNMSDTNNTSVDQPTGGVIISENLIGQVKWFNTKTGYGFITACGGEYDKKDIFVHFSSIKIADPQYLYLVQGEYVNFDLNKMESNKYEFHAVNVHGINGGSIMCELRNTQSDVSRGPPRLRDDFNNERRGPPRQVRDTRETRETREIRETREPRVSSRRVSSKDEEGFERVVRKKSSSTYKPKSSSV
jgi:cold shock CspA family protein